MGCAVSPQLGLLDQESQYLGSNPGSSTYICALLGEVLELSVPQFPHLKIGIIKVAAHKFEERVSACHRRWRLVSTQQTHSAADGPCQPSIPWVISGPLVSQVSYLAKRTPYPGEGDPGNKKSCRLAPFTPGPVICWVGWSPCLHV